MKLSSILGLNARSQLFSYKFNSKKGKKLANSKLLTARILVASSIPTPDIITKFKKPFDVNNFNWDSLPTSFALKPNRGLGGEGIIVVKRRAKDETGKKDISGSWITTKKEKVTIEDLKLHVLDILEGAYSIGNVPDIAFIQEYVGRHKVFRKYAYRGTPDLRVIVFNKVPIIAMLRLPTKESGGRANLHQGAIAVGVDIATGITTKAYWHNRQIVYKPGTNRKLRGIKIPNWNSVLLTAVRSQIASGLGYLGVDVVLHPEKGPMVLELNSQPGLQIQLANMIPLRKRLEKIEDLDVRDAEHGVKIAKALFAGRFADRVKAEEGIKTINAAEEVRVLSINKDKVRAMAKIDSGAWSSSIDKNFAIKLGLYKPENILWYRNKVSSFGREKRAVIPVTFWLTGRKIKTNMSVSNRKSLTYKLLVGRADLSGFIINPEIELEKLEQAKKW